MNHNYLIEIGLEEMPANVIDDSIEQFKNKTVNFLNDNKIQYENIKEFSTPRRLALLVEGISDKQDDIKVEAKGPALKIAKDDDGNWSKAAIGFARKNQVALEDLTTVTIKGTEYLYVKRNILGKETIEILKEMKNIINSLTFKTRMRWSNHSFEYIRPFRWFVSLFDDQIVPFEILGITASSTTQGHRFLGKSINLTKSVEYEQKLASEYVIADRKKREDLILQEIQNISRKNNFYVNIDPQLLNEVVNIVEYPTAFMGTFDPKYLEIPDAVLITSMKDNQRYFYVTDKEKKLLPNFIAVRNGNGDYLENVIKGNEKVLTARLEDALFFYREDQLHSINEYVEQLKQVNFHDELGNIYDKMMRSRKIALLLADKLNISQSDRKDLEEVGSIYDFDLVTQMVGEFSELQGTMGEIYAKIAGLNNHIASAIFEHYLPLSANGELPTTTVGSILAVADKLDTILSFFSIGKIPNGSNDPYALRRQSMGIVRIMTHKKWSVSFTDLFSEFFNADGFLILPEELKKNIHKVDIFIRDRIEQNLSDKEYPNDFIQTVRKISDLNPTKIEEACVILSSHRSDKNFANVIQNLARVQKLFKKEKISDYEYKTVDSNLFENDSERLLSQKVLQVFENWKNNLDLVLLYEDLKETVPLIINYFESTMINAKDHKIRENRYIQMTQLVKLIYNFGDLTQLVI